MTHFDMPAGAGQATPEKRKPADEAGSQGQTTTDAEIVSQADLARKQLETLRAESALQGREAIALPDGRMLLCRGGWCRVYRNLRDLARALDKGWLA